MEFTLAQLAERLGVKIRGDETVRVSCVAPIEHAQAGSLSFLGRAKYRKYLRTTRASALIACEEYAVDSPVPVLVSSNPYALFARAARLLCPAPQPKTGIHPTASIDPTAQVDASAWIGPYSVIGKNVVIHRAAQLGPACIVGDDVQIGAECELVARVTVLGGARLGERVLLHPGVVIGADGFGMAHDKDHWEKIPQLGGVLIGNDVEIGANTTIDRGALGDTVIEDGVKIDNQVQVAHNVHIGAHSAIAGCVGISGSARIGKHCTLAGGVGIVGHLEIADHVHVTGMSMVTRSISEAGAYSAGTPLMPTREWRKNAIRMKQMDRLARRVAVLEKGKAK